MKSIFVFHLMNLKVTSLFVLVLLFHFSSTVYAQTIENLKEDLIKLSSKPGYENDTLYLNKGNELGFMLAESNPDSAIYFLDKQIQLCREANYKKGESEALKIYGNALQNKGEFVASIEYYTNSLNIAKELSNESLVPGILNNIGLVYYNLGNYTEALINFFDAIKGAETTGNLNVKAAALNNVALIYFEQEKFEDAKAKYQEMLSIYQDLGNQGRQILAYNNIGDVELRQNRPIEALKNLKIGYSSALELQSPEFIEMTARTMADIYAAMDSTEKAEGLYRRSITIAEEKGYGVPYSHSLVGLAELYYKKGNLEEASIYANKGLEQAEKMGQTTQLRNANELLAKIYEAEGKYEEALDKYKLFKSFNDSINTAQGQRLAANLESEYEFSKKTLEFEKANLRQRWLTFSAFAGLFTFVIILFLVFRNRNRLDKAFHTLKEKNEEIKNKNEKLVKTVDQLKLTQLQLIQSEKMASLGELTAGIAHEIQNPLNFVKNFSEVSNEMIEDLHEEIKKGDLNEVKVISNDIKINLNKILLHGKRADAIVKAMLEHSKGRTGKSEYTDINSLVDEYLRLSYQSFLAKVPGFHSDFKTELDPKLPKISVIPQDIGKALLNLINNAFYAVNEKAKSFPQVTLNSPIGSSEGKDSYNPFISVKTKTTQSESGDLEVQISIEDNGNGIPESIKEKIFQPFFTTKPSGSGTGLGLSLSYDIIKAQGGELKFESKEGEGTEFIILLKL
ncbi:tetratricopeptide repeat protein [Algoriphagus sp.]|uniref:tetratricopeptide repeat protein n=1 Tax=Algoriphagus sp. TaxID=1872435 RepID=UPI0025E09919|nr:tetratricopeptide repeat protein [Algoriphagus sp.]